MATGLQGWPLATLTAIIPRLPLLKMEIIITFLTPDSNALCLLLCLLIIALKCLLNRIS